MKTLPTIFKKNGFTFTQVKRAGQVAIYQQEKPMADHPDQMQVHFEVGIIRQNEAFFAYGKQFEASETWPASEEWGKRGFTYADLSHAEAKFAVLTLPDNKNAP